MATSGANGPLPKRDTMNAALVVAAAFPQHKRKNLARALGCSHRQARRIIETGTVPEAYETAFLELAETTLGTLVKLLGVIRGARRNLQYRRQMPGRSRMARQQGNRKAQAPHRQASQAEIDFLGE